MDMKKLFIFTLFLLMMATQPGLRAEAADGELPVRVYVDGELADILEYSYIENNTAYVPLREISERLGATVVIWYPETKTVHLEAGETSVTAVCGQDYLVANGRYLFAPEGIVIRHGKTMVPARVLAKALGAEVDWKAATRTVSFTSGDSPIESGDTFYRNEDVYWLSRIIQAEAGGESLAGKIAVANVVLNRTRDSSFPDTVKDVIFDRRYSIQFTPAYSGGIYNTPSAESIAAAKLAIDGAQTAGGSLYFVAVSSVNGSWVSRNRQFYATIDNQVFYT